METQCPPDLAIPVERAVAVSSPEDVVAPEVPGYALVLVSERQTVLDPIGCVCAPLSNWVVSVPKQRMRTYARHTRRVPLMSTVTLRSP